MTYKQQAVAKDLLENTGKSVSKAMHDAGYAPASAKNPQQFTRSKSWQKLMKQYFPYESLFEKHRRLLETTKINRLIFPYSMPDEHIDSLRAFLSASNIDLYLINRDHKKTYIDFCCPDNSVQLGALSLAYKLKGKLSQNLSISGNKVVAILGGLNVKREST